MKKIMLIAKPECPRCGRKRIRKNYPNSASHWYCKTCSRESAKKSYYKRGKEMASRWRKANPESYKKSIDKYRKSTKHKLWIKKYCATPKGQATRLYARCHTRAKNYGLPFSLSKEFIKKGIDSGKCAVTGISFEYEGGLRGAFSPSVDRIIPSKGYTDNNCRIVCCIFNFAKNEWTDEKVIKMAKALMKSIS